MNFSFKYLFLFFAIHGFTQEVFKALPAGTNEIRFVYEIKANILIEKNMVTADKNLLRYEFPELITEINKANLDSITNLISIPLSKFNLKQTRILSSILYHINEIHEGVYDTKKQTTIIYSSRNDSLTSQLFKNIFKEEYHPFFYKTIVDYIDKQTKIIYPQITYKKDFKEIGVVLNDENKVHSNFLTNISKNKQKLTYTTNVLLNENLEKYISPILIFNAAFGVEKMQNIYKTTILKSIKYK